MSLDKHQVREYRELKDSGVGVSKSNQIRFNDGSGETAIHAASKTLVGLLGLQHGYRVDSEVPIVDSQGREYETDVLLWGHKSRMTVCVELEHSPTQEIKEQKLDQYVRHTRIQDMLLVNLNDAPETILDCYGWLGAEIGLEP
jgi:hypothetical protein